MKIKYKILFLFLFLITLLSVSIIVTVVKLSQEGRDDVHAEVAVMLRELQSLSIKELHNAKIVADKGIMDASGLVVIDEITRLSVENQQGFLRVVDKELEKSSGAIEKTLKDRSLAIDTSLSQLLMSSTQSIEDIVELSGRSFDLLANVAQSNVGYLKGANLEGLQRFEELRHKLEEHSLAVSLESSSAMDELLIAVLLMNDQHQGSHVIDEDTLVAHFEQLKRVEQERQKQFVSKVLDEVAIQGKILAEENMLVAEGVNWSIENERALITRRQDAEIFNVLAKLREARNLIRSNIDMSSEMVENTIQSLKVLLPMRLRTESEMANSLINEQISDSRSAAVRAQEHVGERIEKNTQAALGVFDSALIQSQEVIETTLQSSLQKTTRLSLLITAAWVVLAALLGFLMIRSLTKPISEVVHFASRMARGDLNQRLPEGTDEMGEMGKALNLMADEIGKLQAATIDSFNQTLDQVIDCVFMLDPQTFRFNFVNQGAIDHLGYEREELLELTPVDINPELDEDILKVMTQQLASGERDSLVFVSVHRDKSGRDIPVEVLLKYVTPVGNEPRFVAIVRDITERIAQVKEKEQMQAELLHNQKLESVGRLAAGIAHEINTPAQFIGSNVAFFSEAVDGLDTLMKGVQDLAQTLSPEKKAKLEQLLEEADWDYLKEELPAAIKQSQVGVERVTSIVAAMKRFSHPGSKDPVLSDLNEILETSIIVCRNEWKYVAKMVTELSPDLPAVPVIIDEIGQVILNLVINAAQAIAEKGQPQTSEPIGTITISTQVRGDVVELSIRDTGKGIPAPIVDRIFDPFFTTKDVGKGTGQGLAICRDVIVNKHHGTIQVQSQEGQGTTFIIGLPLQ